MKDLSIDDLLRYGFAGGNFLLLYYLQYRPQIAFVGEFATSAAILGICLLVGGVVYVLHRALAFPLILLPIALRLGGYKSPLPEWEYRRSEHLKANEAKRMSGGEWGAQVHFLYSMCWTTLLVLALDWTAGPQSFPTIYGVALGLFYLCAALVHNVRLIRFILLEVDA